MAAFTKFNSFVAGAGNGHFNLNSDSLKVCLCLTAPVSTNVNYADLTEISSGNGYTTGGAAVPSTAYSQTGGLATLTGSPVIFTASGGSIANFRYAVLYDNTATNKDLIGFWDYGATVTVTVGNTFTETFASGIATLQ